MVEYTRDKILPEDMIQRTNLQQHNFMIDAINDIDGRQADIEDITNVNIDDIADLKTDVVALSNEKLDKADIDADLHFGDISVTRDGTAVLMSLDVLNPTTGIVTPISFTIPGATSALAGSMDASSVAWIAGAEERISALEGLSDVKAVSGLSSEPTQAQLNHAWVAETSKQAETGDIIQDVNNAKLWVFVTDTWILYGTLVVFPMATTTSIGGIKDTALNTVGNRWYCHVEADGRVALIGGDVLSTLIDTTVPALQSGINNAVKKTGDTMSGRLYANNGVNIERPGERSINYKRTDIGYDTTTWKRFKRELVVDKDNKTVGETILSCVNGSSEHRIVAVAPRSDGTEVTSSLIVFADSNTGNCSATVPMRAVPGVNDIINKGYLDTRLTAKQDNLVFDVTPTTGSTNPVTSGGVKTALDGKVSKTGDEEIYGTKTFRNGIYQKSTLNITEAGYSQWTIDRLYDVNNEALFDDQITKDNYSTARQVSLANKDANGIYFSVDHIEFVDKNKNYREFFRSPTGVMTQIRHLNADGTGYSITPYRPYSQATNNEILVKGHVADILAPKQDKFNLYEHTIRVWTTTAPDKIRFSLTVLNQSPTEFTLPTLRSYLGTASGGFKQCSGLGWSGDLSVDLIGVRGGAANAFFFEGVERSAGADANLSLNWTLVEVLYTDKVRQIV